MAVWVRTVETVLLTVTEVVITEGAVRTVVEPAEVIFCPMGHVVTVDLTTSVT